MKIAILTLPFHSNYGGVLQAYALQTVLQRLGHEVVVIDKDMFHHRSWLRQQVALGAYLVRKYLLRKDLVYVNLWREDYEKKTVETHIRRFIDTHLNILRVRDLPKEFPADIDAVVVGSDQVWRPKYFKWSYGCGIEYAYLSFLKDLPIKRVSYAASFGTADWEYSDEETARCSSSIELFDAVSVREYSAIILCEEKLGRKDVIRMPDPAFLLDKEDYRSLCTSHSDSGRYLFYYVLDETDETRSKAESVAKERGLTIKQIKGDVDNPSLPLSSRIKAPVEEWLDCVMNAEFVFTDSFHACVFSMLFEKPFNVVSNQSRGTDRIASLLSDFHPDSFQVQLQKQKQSAVEFLKSVLNA